VTPRLLDARELSHPEPLERAVAILRELDASSYLYMKVRKNPIPLLKLAEEHRFNTLSREVTVGEWHVLITPNTQLDLQEYLHV
jgi:hypothetical protein